MTAPVGVELFPVRRFDELFHVGSMDPADKGRVAQSLEGDGVSVSAHPDEWRRIARLGDAPEWRLCRRGSGSSFDEVSAELLDAHAVPDSGRELIVEWAVAQGYVSRSKLWRVPVSCDPDDGWFLFDDEDAARAEFDFVAEEAEDEPGGADLSHMSFTEVDGLVALESLQVRTMNSCPPSLVEDLVLTVFAPDVLGLDGVWWDDRFDPAELSCPRGVIATARLARFTATRLD